MRRYDQRRTRPAPRDSFPAARAVLALAGGLLFGALAGAAEPPVAPAPAATPALPPAPPVPLIEQEPFDLIVLDSANGDAQLKVVPLLDGKRTAPFQVDLGGKYRVRLLDMTGREFDVAGKHIVRVQLFEEALLAEAQRLMAENKFDEAFDYLHLLRVNYSALPGLEATIKQYLYLDAFQLTRNKRYAEAMGVMEELYRLQGDYRYTDTSPSPLEFLGRLVDRIVAEFVEQGDFRAARLFLSRLVRDYGDSRPPTVDQWQQKLEQMAEQKLSEANQHMEAERFHEAVLSANQMFYIWPDIEGGRELRAELARRYPLVRVGVVQPVLIPDAQRLDNWAARRTGRLLHRDLVEFLGPGPEGGQYEFRPGMIDHSEDRRRMILRVNRTANEASEITAHDVARWLLTFADPDSRRYCAPWSALVTGAKVKDLFEVEVDLRRAHVLPESLLRVAQQVEPPGEEALPSGNGRFTMAARSPAEVRFVVKGFRRGAPLAEISERTFASTQQGMAALRRGDIDVLERVPPAEALRMRDNPADARLQVQPYALPTVCLLVPNTAKNPYLAQRDVRRAIEFALDRPTMLSRELLAGREVPGCQVVSGPFPIGGSENDPLGYAYDAAIRPRPYDPRLAKLLVAVAKKQVADLAKKRAEAPPAWAPLVFGHPATETARVSCQTVAAYLKVVGIDCTLQEFPPGETRDVQGQCDLVYVEIAIWEPVVDAVRLLGIGGPAACESPYVRQSLRWLDEAQNWGEVRERLLQIHRAVYEEAALIPLWQMVDYVACDKRLTNVGNDLVWLYQHVDDWRLAAETAN
jgi:hypothetical protein